VVSEVLHFRYLGKRERKKSSKFFSKRLAGIKILLTFAAPIEKRVSVERQDKKQKRVL
jgi:hypothetical protein